MSHSQEEFTKEWKVRLSATTAGKIEHILFDTINQKPIYGARGKLIETLCNIWLDSLVPGRPVRSLPSLEEVRDVH